MDITPPPELPTAAAHIDLTSFFDPHVWFSIELIGVALLVLMGLKFIEYVNRQANR